MLNLYNTNILTAIKSLTSKISMPGSTPLTPFTSNFRKIIDPKSLPKLKIFTPVAKNYIKITMSSKRMENNVFSLYIAYVT